MPMAQRGLAVGAAQLHADGQAVGGETAGSARPDALT